MLKAHQYQWIAVIVLFVLNLLASVAWAQKERVLYNFSGGTDGGNPTSSLVFDKHKNLYGTTASGGGSGCGGYGCGTVFKFTPSGKESVLYSFVGGTDGAGPVAGLTFDSLGNIYGTTISGGSTGCGGSGCGTVFKLTPLGKETVLYSFTGIPDGYGPFGSVVFDKKGNMYGTTGAGGSFNSGTVFEILPSGQEIVRYSFSGSGDGELPFGGIIFDKNGNIYGTTANGGGTGCGGVGCGTVFELTPSGQESVLYSFVGGTDGASPQSSLIFGKAGDLYGTTNNGGTYGMGTVFEVTPSGKETVLYSFAGGKDGATPGGGVVFGKNGILYGMTSFGGRTACDLGCGTVFKVSSSSKESVLHRFGGGNDGANPGLGELVFDTKGNMYGTTSSFGAFGWGTIFKMAKTLDDTRTDNLSLK
jgi:uncharacterized repeat protein (TIGR03803 family)